MRRIIGLWFHPVQRSVIKGSATRHTESHTSRRGGECDHGKSQQFGCGVKIHRLYTTLNPTSPRRLQLQTYSNTISAGRLWRHTNNVARGNMKNCVVVEEGMVKWEIRERLVQFYQEGNASASFPMRFLRSRRGQIPVFRRGRRPLILLWMFGCHLTALWFTSWNYTVWDSQVHIVQVKKD